MEPDMKIQDEGSIVLFVPLTDFARQWVDENLALESWQWFGDGFAVEHRYADPLRQGMENDGLAFEL